MFFSCSTMSFQQTISGSRSNPIHVVFSCPVSFSFLCFREFRRLIDNHNTDFIICYIITYFWCSYCLKLTEEGASLVWTLLFWQIILLSENFHIFWLKIFLRPILHFLNESWNHLFLSLTSFKRNDFRNHKSGH